METLNLPVYAFKLKKSAPETLIFDEIRQKYVLLTPEEWVRQHFIHFLISFLGYPKGLVSVERGTTYNTLSKRTDLRVYGPEGVPLLLVECKAAEVPITAIELNQALVYNRVIRAPFLVLTNGINHFCWQTNFPQSKSNPLPHIPDYVTACALVKEIDING